MQAITLDAGESEVFARAALALKYDDPTKPAPISESQILMPRRFDDRRPDLWSVFNRTQENLTKGGLSGRSTDRKSTRLNSSHLVISYAVFCLKKKKKQLRRARWRVCVTSHSASTVAALI